MPTIPETGKDGSVFELEAPLDIDIFAICLTDVKADLIQPEEVRPFRPSFLRLLHR
jgi:hypothetical protein